MSAVDGGGLRRTLARAVAYEQYLINAQAIGVSRDAAMAELRAVQQELAWPEADHDIAFRRLVAGVRLSSGEK